MTLTSQNIDRHQKNEKNQTTRCTKHRPKNQKNQTFQQLLRSGPIVRENFSFFIFFVGAFAGLDASSGLLFLFFFGACAGLVHLLVSLCFLMLVQVLVILDSRLCMFGSWPYFKLMFQRSKHTVIFE